LRELLLGWGLDEDRRKFERIFKSLVGGLLPASCGIFLKAAAREEGGLV